MAHRFDPIKFSDRQAKIEAARTAVTRLIQIEDNIIGATLANSQAAIKDMATYERNLIRLVAGEII